MTFSVKAGTLVLEIIGASGHLGSFACFIDRKVYLYVKPTEGNPARGRLHALPLGAIQPTGWLREQLQLQAEGLTGHLDEIWPDVGPNSAWLGGTGENWERGPYYCDGLVPLAFLLRDERLLAKAQRWIEHVLLSQREDGQFGPATNEDWWPRMVMLKALISYYSATRDERVQPFMTRYFRYQLAMLPQRPLEDWAHWRGYDNIFCVYWLYERTREAFLLELVDLLAAQTLDWSGYFAAFAYKDRQPTGDANRMTHVVNVAMGLKSFAFRNLREGAAEHLQAAEQAIETLMRYHGQVQGMFSGDEHLAGTSPVQGVELCAVVEFMFSLEQLVSIFGEGRFADWLEQIAYNALPATITADMRAHQYDQQSNQVLCTRAPRDWTLNGDDANIFGLEPNFGCCTANLHQGWPKFAQSLWMSADDAGLAAVAYAPCTVQTTLADGTEVTIEEETRYPFEETIQFTLHLKEQTTFPLYVRLPEWCAEPLLSVNGQATALADLSQANGFVCIRRLWSEGERVELRLPMRVREIARSNGAFGVALGPLVCALAVGERWQRLPETEGFGDWEVYPTTDWNYGLVGVHDDERFPYRVERGPLNSPPFGHEQSAVRVVGWGCRLPDWQLVHNSAGPLPPAPLAVSDPLESVTLIPYGCARLRIAELPRVRPAE